MGKLKQEIFQYVGELLKDYITDKKNDQQKIIGFEVKNDVALRYREQLEKFINEITIILPEDSHNFLKSEVKQKVITVLSKIDAELIPEHHRPLITFCHKLIEYCEGEYPKTIDSIKNLQSAQQSAQIKELSTLLNKYDTSIRITDDFNKFLKQLAKTASKKQLPGSALLPNPYDESKAKIVVNLLQQLLHEYLFKNNPSHRPSLKFIPSNCSKRFIKKLKKTFSDEENFFTNTTEKDRERILSQMEDKRILEVLKKIAPFFAATKDNLQEMPLICCFLDFLKENECEKLNVSSIAELMKSKLERQFAKELCDFSRLLNPAPDLSGFREGQTKQVGENASAQPQFFTRVELRNIFSTGEFLNRYDTPKQDKSRLQLLKPSASQLCRSASCHF